VEGLALGELIVVLGAQSDLPDGTAVALDHILVTGTLQIDLGIDGRVLAVVHGIRLDEQVGGGVLVLRLQTVVEESLQPRLQLVQLVGAMDGLLVGDVAAPGALGPGTGGLTYVKHSVNLLEYSRVIEETPNMGDMFPLSHMKKFLSVDTAHLCDL